MPKYCYLDPQVPIFFRGNAIANIVQETGLILYRHQFIEYIFFSTRMAFLFHHFVHGAIVMVFVLHGLIEKSLVFHRQHVLLVRVLDFYWCGHNSLSCCTWIDQMMDQKLILISSKSFVECTNQPLLMLWGTVMRRLNMGHELLTHRSLYWDDDYTAG